MGEKISYDRESQNMGYFPFMEPEEKTVFTAAGNLENIINGHLVLTTRKLFFYFYSNINRDKKFIATYPYIISVRLKEGIIYSTLTVESRKESHKIIRLRKKDALKFYHLLNDIIKENKKDS
jgi:hypothetical protein